MSRQTDFAKIKALEEKVRSWRRVSEKLQSETNTLTTHRDKLLAACRDFMKFANKDLPKGFVPPEKWFDELKANTSNIGAAIKED